MTIGGISEITVYVLAVMQAVSVGLILAFAQGSRYRAAMYIAGLLMIGVAVVAGFILGGVAPWIGPTFAVVAALTGVLTSAKSLGADPVMRDESFGQRIIFVVSRRPRSSPRDGGTG